MFVLNNKMTLWLGFLVLGLATTVMGTGISYSSYFGGTNQDIIFDVDLDDDGYIYVVGTTKSTNFPVTVGAFQTIHADNGVSNDAFIAKFSPGGSNLIYSTFLGGGFDDGGAVIYATEDGEAVVAGTANSTNFPLKNAFQSTRNGSSDLFISKLTADGTGLVFSTYYGGNSNEFVREMFMDKDGRIFVCGETSSTNLFTTNAFQSGYGGGAFDAYFAVFNATGSLETASYFGSTLDDRAYGFSTDANSNGYLAIHTLSSNLVVTAGAFQTNVAPGSSSSAYDVYVARFDPSFTSVTYATYWGGSSNEFNGNAFSVSSDGWVYLSGCTFSTNFPLVNAVQTNYRGGGDVYVTAFDLNSTSVVLSTYWGGTGTDETRGIGHDDRRNLYLSGSTSSTNFPLTNAVFGTYGGGSQDAFFIKVNVIHATFLLSSYLGGSLFDIAFDGSIDPLSHEFAVVGQVVSSTNFYLTANAYQTNYGGSGSGDGFVTVYQDNYPPELQCLYAQQTSTNGEGLVTITNTLYDIDSDSSELHVQFSTDNGATWTNAFIQSATASLGTVTISNEASRQLLNIITTNGSDRVTNTLTLVWETTNGPAPISLCTNTLIKLSGWNGLDFGYPVTSQPFLVDNEAPVGPGGLTSATHNVSEWNTNTNIAINWNEASDGNGVGVAGYSFAFTNETGHDAQLLINTIDTNAISSSLADGSNYYFIVRVADQFGNWNSTTEFGPFWIDATVPEADSATVTAQTGAFGDYVVSSVVTSTWSGFTDNLSGIDGYYYDFSDNGGTTNGTFTTLTTGALSGALLDQTNTVYVWALDLAKNIGLAVSDDILVLSDGGDWDGDGYTNLEEEQGGTDATDPNDHPNTAPVVTWIFSQQLSTNGEGLVTITNTLFDYDGDIAELKILFSTDNGASWTNAWIQSASAEYGTVTISNEISNQVLNIATTNGTNALTLIWETTNGPAPIVISTNTLLQFRGWDGIDFGNTVTSEPFLVDNEAPTGPAGLTSSTHNVSTWNNNASVTVNWNAASDGNGIGVAGYGIAFTNEAGVDASFEVNTTDTNASSSTLADGTNHYFIVRTKDNFGNWNSTIEFGPFWIDTVMPDASGATVTIPVSDFGDYLVSSVITSSWSGFSDSLSGINGYYLSFSDNGGTTNGNFTTATTEALSGATLDQTNTVFVWAEDLAGNIGSAVSASILVLDPDSDYDGDGYTSGEEEVVGTSATNAASVFNLSIGLTTNRSVSVSWTYATNRTYFIHQTPNLVTQSSLQTYTNPPYVVSTNWATWTDTNSVAGSTNQNYWIGVQ